MHGPAGPAESAPVRLEQKVRIKLTASGIKEAGNRRALADLQDRHDGLHLNAQCVEVGTGFLGRDEQRRLLRP